MSSSVTSKYSTATTTTASSSVSSSSSSLSYPKTKIAIFNLSYGTTENELTQHCCQFGLIHNVVIPKDKDGISRGFGFVTFDTEEDASFALQALNGHPMNERTLRADWSKDQPKPRRQRVIITTRGGPPKRR
jgi:RNA recognition motif-containing protein